MRTVLALFWALTGRKLKHKSSLQPGRPGRGRGKRAFPGLLYSYKSRSKEHWGSPEHRRAGDRRGPGTPTTFHSVHLYKPLQKTNTSWGALMPTKDRQHFCFPGLTWENHTLHGAPFIYNTHLEAIKFYLRITVHSHEYGNLLIYFLTNLLAFPFQRLYNIFILDLSSLHTYSIKRSYLSSGHRRHHCTCT